MVRPYSILLFVSLWWLGGAGIPAGPFPVEGPIFNGNGEKIGKAQSYPRYVEIVDEDNNNIGKVGVMVDKGLARIHMVGQDPDKSIMGTAKDGVIYDRQNKRRGTYFWTPTYSYVYDNQGKRAGSTKCIAWPRVCSVGVAGFLLGLYKDPLEPPKEETPAPSADAANANPAGP